MSALIDVLGLAWSSLRSTPTRAAVLVAGLGVALFLPAFTGVVLPTMEAAVLARAESTPVLVGSKGDPFDLTLASLYLTGEVAAPVPFGTVASLRDADYGVVAPLYVRHTASGSPIVGTSLAYYGARGLELSDGRLPALLGEVVAGAEAAAAFRLGPGDRVRSDQDNLYDLTGGYPTVLEVVGVLAPTGTADDRAFFADVRTTWVLDGALHGHDAVAAEDAISAQGERIEASAAVMMFQEITPANRASFHLHGDLGALPITAVAVWPTDARRHDQLLGALALDEALVAVRPVEVVREALGIVASVRDALAVYEALLAVSTLAFAALVVSLSLRLRRDELALMRRLGASRLRIAAVVGAEIAVVALGAIGVAAALTAVAGAVWRTLLPG